MRGKWSDIVLLNRWRGHACAIPDWPPEQWMAGRTPGHFTASPLAAPDFTADALNLLASQIRRWSALISAPVDGGDCDDEAHAALGRVQDMLADAAGPGGTATPLGGAAPGTPDAPGGAVAEAAPVAEAAAASEGAQAETADAEAVGAEAGAAVATASADVAQLPDFAPSPEPQPAQQPAQQPQPQQQQQHQQPESGQSLPSGSPSPS
ncbi:unnamed protein product [Prorocentrum cordatum]|uniref:Uncharacterized protein n=1 Tax=Prorocentrum cordatum TaxID=2364126 RepID=A0ABN9WSQ7_9DINO|nr:unnamed protein product [Polarella glacialis]